jgi:hypothetical protein
MSMLGQRLRRNNRVSTLSRRCLHGCRRHHFNRYLGLYDANARADAAGHADDSDPPDRKKTVVGNPVKSRSFKSEISFNLKLIPDKNCSWGRFVFGTMASV